MTYREAYADRQYLWAVYGPANDMTGGYVDSNDLEELLASPAKPTAAKLLAAQIDYWFEAGPERSGAALQREVAHAIERDDRVHAIARRHGISDWTERRWVQSSTIRR